MSDLVAIALIVRPHGVRGALVARPASDGSDVLLALRQLDLRRPGATTRHRVRRAGWLGRQVLLEVDGIVDRNAAESLVGAEVVVPKSALPPPAAGEFYVDQLVGLAVEDGEGRTVGAVRGVESAVVQTWLVVDVEGREVLVPFTEGLVTVDLPGRTVRVAAPEGLFDAPDAA